MADQIDRLKAALSNRYTIERELGSGGMATVYLAHDPKYDRKVAIKVLRLELAESLGTERFVREIQVTARLSHPHILALLDSGEAGGFLYYAMPYVEGESLRDRLNREKQLPFEDVLSITQDVASALDYAHKQGLVHRDIKPENILFQADKAVVADFGIAKAVSEAGGDRLTATGIAVGTPHYMSPEQAHGDRDVDGRCDVYAFGCVVYEMLAGDPPFTGSSAQAIIARKIAETPPSLRVVREKVTESIEQAIETALEKTPADRYRSAGEFAAALRTAVTAPVPVIPTDDRPKFTPRKTAVVGVAGFAAVAGAWWFATCGHDPGGFEVPVNPTKIAVFPASGSNVNLGIDVAQLLNINLNGAGELTVADYRRVFPAVQEMGSGVLSIDSAASLARRFGAGMFILSMTVDAGQAVTIQSSLYDQSRGPGSVIDAEQEGTLDELYEMVDAIARRLVAGHPAGYGTWLDEAGRHGTNNYDALKHYLNGERYWMRGHNDSAVIAFDSAITEDSTWSLAWYRRYQAGKMLGDARLRGELLQQAWAKRGGLGERDSLILQAERADLLGYPAEKEAAARALVRRYPQHPESWMQLATWEHFSTWRGTGLRSEARESYERGLALDSNYAEIRAWLPYLLLAEGEFAEAEAAANCGGAADYACLIAQWLQRTPDELARELRDQPWQNSTYATVDKASYGRDPLGAQVIGTRLAEDSTAGDEARANAHLLLAHVAAAAGQWEESKSALERAESTFSGTALIQNVVIATMPFLAVDTMELSALQGRLREWDGRAPGLNEVQLGIHFTPLMLLDQTRLYLDGLLAATLGDSADAMRAAVVLEAEAGVVFNDSIDFGTHYKMLPVHLRHAEERARGTATKDPFHLARDLALEIRALVQLNQGDTAGALATLERARLEAADQSLLTLSLPARPLGRYLRAEILSARDQDEEALAWFDSFGLHENMEFPYLAPSHFRRGQILERLGRPDEAAEHYATFLQMWGEADERYQDVVQQAREALVRLRPDRPARN